MSKPRPDLSVQEWCGSNGKCWRVSVQCGESYYGTVIAPTKAEAVLLGKSLWADMFDVWKRTNE